MGTVVTGHIFGADVMLLKPLTSLPLRRILSIGKLVTTFSANKQFQRVKVSWARCGIPTWDGMSSESRLQTSALFKYTTNYRASKM